MSDYSDGVAKQTGTAVMSKLLGSASIANPYTAGAALALEAVKTGNNSASNGTFETAVDHSGWNVNFGEGSITSSANREGLSQWIGIAAGIVTLLVAFKMMKG